MFYTLSWLLIIGLFGLWSFAIWAVHAVSAWAASKSGALVGGSAAEALSPPEWLAVWIPADVVHGLLSAAAALKPLADMLLGTAPALAGALSVVLWLVWGLGSLLLIVLGLVLHGGIALLRRRGASA
jgi:hypothetical protein